MIHREDRGALTILRMEHGKVQAFDLEFLSDLIDAFQQSETSSAKALVLTGTGKTFSAGVDLFRLLEEGRPYLESFLPKLNEMLQRVFLFPKPVVCAINGHAIAGGCVLSSACDYRMMNSEGGQIGVPELIVGVPFPLLPFEIVRFSMAPQHVQRVIYTGKTYAPQEAMQAGLLDELAGPEPLLQKACEVAAQFGAIPSSSFRIVKEHLRKPVWDRVARYANDAKILEAWSDPETHRVIRQYLNRTIKKKTS